VPSAESGPEPYVFEEPPYPTVSEVGFGAPMPEADQLALAAYWEELHRRQAKARAWQEHEQRVAAEAAARELPVGRATLGDGLVRALLRPSSEKVRVQLLVDPLSGWARTSGDELLPPSALRRLLAALPTGCDLGRAKHEVPAALRALLGQVDGQRCRFPGCGRTKKLHAHHVRWWSRGGRTDLANLILVRLSHEWRASAVVFGCHARLRHGCERAWRRPGSVAADAPVGAGLAA
jgi:hypothetical protein